MLGESPRKEKPPKQLRSSKVDLERWPHQIESRPVNVCPPTLPGMIVEVEKHLFVEEKGHPSTHVPLP